MLELLEEAQILKIVDNNPDRLMYLLAGMVGLYVIYSFIYVKMNKKRKEKLTKLKRKIQTRHEQIVYENQKRNQN